MPFQNTAESTFFGDLVLNQLSHFSVMILTVREVTRAHTETWCAVMSDKTVTLSEERIAYLEGLVRQARTAAAVFTQLRQEDVDGIVKPMVLAGWSRRSTWPALRWKRPRSA